MTRRLISSLLLLSKLSKRTTCPGGTEVYARRAELPELGNGMTTAELRQCLEEAFGGLEPPNFDDLTYSQLDPDFAEAVKTETPKARRWQELRPLNGFLYTALSLLVLRGEACRYYLPAFLYAMTDPEDIWRYLGPVLNRLWYENEFGDPLHNNRDLREEWEEFTALLTDAQKRCIAHCLVEILKSADSIEECAEVHMELDRIEYMLEKYWKAWL